RGRGLSRILGAAATRPTRAGAGGAAAVRGRGSAAGDCHGQRALTGVTPSLSGDRATPLLAAPAHPQRGVTAPALEQLPVRAALHNASAVQQAGRPWPSALASPPPTVAQQADTADPHQRRRPRRGGGRAAADFNRPLLVSPRPLSLSSLF